VQTLGQAECKWLVSSGATTLQIGSTRFFLLKRGPKVIRIAELTGTKRSDIDPDRIHQQTWLCQDTRLFGIGARRRMCSFRISSKSFRQGNGNPPPVTARTKLVQWVLPGHPLG